MNDQTTLELVQKVGNSTSQAARLLSQAARLTCFFTSRAAPPLQAARLPLGATRLVLLSSEIFLTPDVQEYHHRTAAEYHHRTTAEYHHFYSFKSGYK